jgi:predicted Zn-dependent protease with MMP-like domain
MTPAFDRLLELARNEVQTAIGALPNELRPAAKTVVVTLEPTPNDGLVADGIAPDTLGLFLGESMADPPSSHPQPTQIILFLENLWQFAEHNEAVYLDEVRITYLHELGHYFGFDEDDLEERGLE